MDFLAATSHSVTYYVVGFIAGFSMITAGIVQMVRLRKQKAPEEAEKAAVEQYTKQEEKPAGEKPDEPE